MKDLNTVPLLVEAELKRNCFLLQTIQSGIGNISAVAAKMKPSIQEQLGRKIELSAISMALRRAVKALPSYDDIQDIFPLHIEISTRSNIYEVAFARSEKNLLIADKLRKSVSIRRHDFFSIAEGNYEVVIFTNQANREQINKVIGRQKKTSELNGLCCVTVNWPPETKDIPGIYFRVTRALAFAGVSIQSFHTIGSEMMIFVKETQLKLAHETIVDLLSPKLKRTFAK